MFLQRPEHEEPAPRPQYIAVPQPAAPAYPAPSQYRLVSQPKAAKPELHSAYSQQSPLFQAAQYEQ